MIQLAISPLSIACILIVGLAIFFYVAILARLHWIEGRIAADEERVIVRYREKLGKIPALIEIMRKYTDYDDIFLELTHLHKVAIISSVKSIYDLLESNSRIHREFLFLMRVSVKIPELHRDGNFLYIRDFMMFYESSLMREIESVNLDIGKYNRLLALGRYTFIGAIISAEPKIPLAR